MTIAVRPSLQVRIRGRSYLALVLTPEAPLDAWFNGLDNLAEKAPGFFRRRPVVVDASRAAENRAELKALMQTFAARGIRVVGLDGVQPSWASPELPPVFVGGRDGADPVTVADPDDGEGAAPAAVAGTAGPAATSAAAPAAAQAPVPTAPAEAAPAELAPLAAAVAAPGAQASLVIAEPVRSGMSIFHPTGDVTVIGSVASGAEIVAGGSIHVYGTLRGRAMAGCAGAPGARIFCRRMEAELLAIDGLYRTAEDIPPELEGRPAQAWLEHDLMRFSALG